MTITGSAARLTSFCDTLPSRSRATGPAPRLPTTMTSAAFSFAMSMIDCATSPERDFELDRGDAGALRALSRLRQGFGRERLQQFLQPDLLGLREPHHRLVGQAVAADDVGDQEVGPFALGQARRVIDRAVRGFRAVGRHQNPFHRSAPLLAQI